MSLAKFPKLSALLSGFLIVFGGAACSDDETTEDPTAKATIASFSASETSVVEGDVVTLTWATRNAKSVSLLANGYRLDHDVLAVSGEWEVSPNADTTYRLEALGRNGSATTKEVQVKVEAFGPPKVEAFEASATGAAKGESVTLTWSTRGASSISISEKNGRRLDLPEASPSQGSIEVEPQLSTVYVLQARNSYGSTSAEVEVTIGLRPMIRLTSSADVIEVGGRAILSWTVENADSVRIEAPGGEPLFTGKGVAGSLEILPELSGVYRAVAEGKGGEGVATALISIRPVVSLFTALVHGEVRTGANAQIQWDVAGAEELLLTNEAGFSLTLPQASGSIVAPVGTGGGFLLHARSGALTTQSFATVSVTERPLVLSLTTSDVVTAGRGQRGNATLSWEIDGAAKIRMNVSPGGAIDVTDKNPRLDEVGIVLTGPGTITVIASNNSGETVVTIPSPVDPVPGIEEFFAAPSRVGSGEAVEIHWKTVDAKSVILEKDGVSMGVPPASVVGSHPTGNLAVESSYVLRAFNGLGFEVASQPLVVSVGSPNILAFDTSDKRHRAPVDSTVRLEWSNDGGSSLTVTDQEAGQVVCSTSVFTEIRRGGCNVVMPSTQKDKPYLLTVSNASGVDTQTLLVQAVTGPMVDVFTTDLPEITEGDSLIFSWIVTPDADGNLPDVFTLTDDMGREYDLTGVGIVGSKRFPISILGTDQSGNKIGLGTRTFTLTAGGDSVNPPVGEATTQVEIHGIPVIGAIDATPDFAEADNDPILLSWTSDYGASLEVYQLDRQNNVVGSPVYSTTAKAQVDAGTTTVNPTVQNPHVRLVVRNPVGHPTTKDFRIGVDPATIFSFTGNGIDAPTTIDLLEGDQLTLEWETKRTTKTTLDHETLANGWGQAQLIDLSQRSTATNLAYNSSGDGRVTTVSFPSGFVFPYGGAPRSSLVITTDGWVSFDTSASTEWDNDGLPGTSTNKNRIHVAPFWDDLYANANGTVFWELLGASPNRYFIVQWSQISMWAEQQTANLNFQAILSESGIIEFRYGSMSAVSQSLADGSSATIGVQAYGGGTARVLSDRIVRAGGLSGKSFFYLPGSVPLTGSMQFTPSSSTIIALTATNAHSEHSESIAVNVYPPGSLTVEANPPEPLPGQISALTWQSQNLTSLVIEDGAGNVIHTAAGASLNTGSFSLGALAQGIHSFTIRGIGHLPRDQIIRTIVLSVNDPFSIDSFEASESRIKLTDPAVDLIWTTTNATSITLVEEPGGAVTIIDPADFAMGSVSRSPARTTTYRLLVESHGREREAEQTVEVRTVWIDDMTAGQTTLPAGGSTTLSWATSGTGKVTITPDNRPVGPMVEVTSQSPFSSIATVGSVAVNKHSSGSTDFARYPISFPEDFAFPFFGREMTQGQMMADGYFTFNRTETESTSSQLNMPTNNTSNALRAFALFVGDHNAINAATPYYHYVKHPTNPRLDHMIFEWSHWRFYFSSDGGNDPDLNFQLVLYRSGAFEYRYGTMVAADAAKAAGSITATGFQDPTATKGYQLSYNSAVPGGLANRSWRWEPLSIASAGTTTVQPASSGAYTICTEDDDWRECETIFINVVHPGDLVISEVMVNPVGGLANQWFEVRNVSAGVIDLEGKTIKMGTQTHEIQSGSPILLAAGDYAVLSRSPSVDLAPVYVYGAGMDLESPAGDVGIEWDGVLLGKTSWTSSWTFASGISLGLRGEKFRVGVATRTTAGDYCSASSSYDGGTSMGTPGRASDCLHNGYILDAFSDMPFIDIGTTGTRTDLLDVDDAAVYWPSGLGFTMPFFNGTVNELWANSNGLLGLVNASVNATNTWSNRDLTGTGTTANTGIVAAFWDDLAPQPDGTSYFAYEWKVIDGLQVAVLQWGRYRRGSEVGVITFQAQLWENGDIVVAYGDISGNSYYFGSDATVGIEAPGGSPELQYLYNQAALRAHQVLHFQKQ